MAGKGAPAGQNFTVNLPKPPGHLDPALIHHLELLNKELERLRQQLNAKAVVK